MTPVGDPCTVCATLCDRQGVCPVCARYQRVLESIRRAATPGERKSAERMRGVIYRLYVGRCSGCDTPVQLKSLLFGTARAAGPQGRVKLLCGDCAPTLQQAVKDRLVLRDMEDTLKEAPRKKTKTGIAFGKLRWGKTEPGQERKDGKNRIAVLMGRKRWEGLTPEQRSELASRAGSAQQKGKPRDPNAPRCPCGAMTLKRAEARAGKTGTSKGHLKACRFFKPHN